jgi:hypothetical protein
MLHGPDAARLPRLGAEGVDDILGDIAEWLRRCLSRAPRAAGGLVDRGPRSGAFVIAT